MQRDQGGPAPVSPDSWGKVVKTSWSAGRPSHRGGSLSEQNFHYHECCSSFLSLYCENIHVNKLDKARTVSITILIKIAKAIRDSFNSYSVKKDESSHFLKCSHNCFGNWMFFISFLSYRAILGGPQGWPRRGNTQTSFMLVAEREILETNKYL